MVIYSGPSIHNIDNRRLRIWKNKCIILNVIENEPDIDEIYLYAKDPYEAKYQFLINKREGVSINHFEDHMIENKKLNSIVTELFIGGRKLNISLVFITQSYFKVQKDVRLNATHFFITKIPNNRELRDISINHS